MIEYRINLNISLSYFVHKLYLQNEICITLMVGCPYTLQMGLVLSNLLEHNGATRSLQGLQHGTNTEASQFQLLRKVGIEAPPLDLIL